MKTHPRISPAQTERARKAAIAEIQERLDAQGAAPPAAPVKPPNYMQFCASLALAHQVDALAEDQAVRPGEIDVFKDAGSLS